MQNETRSTSPFTQPSHGQQHTPTQAKEEKTAIWHSGARPRRAQLTTTEPARPHPTAAQPTRVQLNRPRPSTSQESSIARLQGRRFRAAYYAETQPDMIEAMSPMGCSRHCTWSGQQFRHRRGEAAATTQLYGTDALFLIVFLLCVLNHYWAVQRHNTSQASQTTPTRHPSNYREKLLPSKRNTYLTGRGPSTTHILLKFHNAQFICAAYPRPTEWLIIVTFFMKISIKRSSITSTVLLMGDWNARKCIWHSGSRCTSHTPALSSLHLIPTSSHRYNQDHIGKKMGKELAHLCRSLGLYMINGEMKGLGRRMKGFVEGSHFGHLLGWV